jgi:beta-galactosidase
MNPLRKMFGVASDVARLAPLFALASAVACQSDGSRGSEPGAAAGATSSSTAAGAAGPGSANGQQGRGGATAEGVPNLARAGSNGAGAASAEGEPPFGLPTPRISTRLADGWRFLRADAPDAQAPGFDDSGADWQNVNVPHTYNALDGQDGGSNYYQGVAWYRRHLTAPPADAGARMYLEFDAANSIADVYLNGVYLGQHRGGFARFRFDATSAWVSGDNVLAVKVDNALAPDIAPLSADFTFFGGLYRDVKLVSVAPLHVDLDDHGASGVYLRTTDVTAESAQLTARVRVTNAEAAESGAELTLSVLDASGLAVATFTQTLAVPAGQTIDVELGGALTNPHLWDGRADPYLYTASVELRRDAGLLDAVVQPFGVRSFGLDPDTGFSLNGHYLDLHGVNRHQDRLDLGWAISNAEHDEDMALIHEIGASAVRLAHYQQAQYFYDLCDQEGLVVWAEIPLVNAITDSDAFRENAQAQLRELILQSYNHPSIVFWGIGNEQRTDDAPTNALLGDLASLVESEDPSRISVYAHCCGSDTAGVTRHSEAIGYNYYYGWYMGTYDQVGPWADAAHAASPTTSLALSEYGAGAALSQHQEPAVQPAAAGLFHPEEYQAVLHEAYWQQLAARPYIWGKFVWNMFDFAIDSRNEGDTPGRNDKGLVSYDRQVKKDAFFLYKANWSSDPFVHITSRRFNPRTTPTVDVKVYSNLESVTLTVNGTPLPAQSAADHIFRWSAVPLELGQNEVTAQASTGTTSASDTLVWTRE